MIKHARKPSNDPLQEKLRLNKSQWNKEVSVFIDNLINLKKLMNGWPSKFNMERSTIKEPIPSDPKTILGVLVNDFQDLAQRGNSLVVQQIDYSKNRKKKQPKSPAGTPAPNLSQQLTASVDYQLEALASTPISRFYSKVKGPWFGKSSETRIRKYRISMLNSCADLYKQLETFEASIMGSSPESIFASSKILEKIENQVNFILNTITAYKSIMPEITSTKPINNLDDDSKFLELDAAINDFKKNHLNFTDLDANLVAKLNENIFKFEQADLKDQSSLASIILHDYKAIIDDFNRNHDTFAKTLGEALFAKQAALEVMAQAFLTKWLGKIKHHLSPFDKTSALRLDIYKMAEDSRKILDEMMNGLEKDFDIEFLINKSNNLYNSLTNIRSLMRPLEDIIKNNMFDKTFIDLLDKSELTEYDFNLSKKQKEQLRNKLQTRKFRELSQLYQKR